MPECAKLTAICNFKNFPREKPPDPCFNGEAEYNAAGKGASNAEWGRERKVGGEGKGKG